MIVIDWGMARLSADDVVIRSSLSWWYLLILASSTSRCLMKLMDTMMRLMSPLPPLSQVWSIGHPVYFVSQSSFRGQVFLTFERLVCLRRLFSCGQVMIISQGSVAAFLMWDGSFSMVFVANFIRFPAVQNLENWLIFDKVANSLMTRTFLRHSVDKIDIWQTVIKHSLKEYTTYKHYTVSQKNDHIFIFWITLSKMNRF